MNPVRLIACLFILAFAATVVAEDELQTTTIAEDKSKTEEPAVYKKETISLIDAVRLTLALNPNIKIQEETVIYEEGNLLVEQGQFDTSLLAKLEGKFTQEEIDPETFKQEKKKRDDLRQEITDLEKALKMENAQDAYLRDLKTGSQKDGILEYVSDEGPELSYQEESELETTQRNYDDSDQLSRQLFENETDPDQKVGIENKRLEKIRSFRSDVRENIREHEQNKTDSIAELQRLGSIPKATQKSNVAANLSLKKTYRNGIQATQSLDITEEGWQFRHKDQTKSPIYKSNIKFDLLVPLGKNRGKASTGAGEVSAELMHEASRMTLRHTASKSISETAHAYWDLVAAMEKYRLQEKSTSSRETILSLSKELVEAEELPRSELARNYASLADARAAQSEAMKAFDSARLNLARAIGLKVPSIDGAPLPADSFPGPPNIEAIERLTPAPFYGFAIAERDDYKAAVNKYAATEVRYRATKINLAPKADFGIYLSYSGTDQNANIGKGLEDIFSEWTGPSIGGRIDIDWPIKNNAAKGSLLKAEASKNMQEITSNELSRAIRTDIINTVESIKENALRLNLLAESVNYYGKTMNTETIKFKVKDSTLLDLIDTEEQLTNSVITLTDAKAEYAKLIADLRYHTASLMAETKYGLEIWENDLITIPDINGYKRN